MRIGFFVITALIFFATSCNSKSIPDSEIIVTDIGVDYQHSKTLIERYNRLREVNKLNRIIQDTILDDWTCKLLPDIKLSYIHNYFFSTPIAFPKFINSQVVQC